MKVYHKLEYLSLAGLSSLVKCLQVRPDPTKVKHSMVLHSRVDSRPYPEALYKAGKAYQGQTPSLIQTFVKYGLNFFYNMKPWGHNLRIFVLARVLVRIGWRSLSRTKILAYYKYL